MCGSIKVFQCSEQELKLICNLTYFYPPPVPEKLDQTREEWRVDTSDILIYFEQVSVFHHNFIFLFSNVISRNHEPLWLAFGFGKV